MPSSSRPNILWICTDQQRFDTLGCYGNSHVHTPNIDRLAESGVLFSSAFCQNPICSPSRGSFLTGRYPRTCRMRQNGADIPSAETLVTKLLADGGYYCGLVGKLHISACNPATGRESERRIDDGYDEFIWSHDPLDVWAGNRYRKWLRSQGQNQSPKPSRHSDHIAEGVPEHLHHTTWIANETIGFIRNAGDFESPWLCSVNIFDPHHPFDPPEAYLEPYLGKLGSIPLPNYTAGELDDKPGWQSIDHRGAYGGTAGFPYDSMSEKDHRLVRAAYWAMCDLVDVHVGRILDELERTGQRENTIVIFMSDHGEMLGDHGIYLKGPYFYEPAIRVPLIVSWPEVFRPRESDALVELLDLPQTLLQAAGVGGAAGIARRTGMQGRSLWPLLTGRARDDEHRSDVYCEYYNSMPWHSDGDTPQLTMLRTRRHKICVNHGNGDGELYDLERDPAETENRWDASDYASTKSEMLLGLTNRMAFTVDPLPERRTPW